MAYRTLFLAAVLVVIAGLVAPVAEAQLLGGLGQLLINGTVYCSVSTATKTTAVFPNALVQLQCGNAVVAATTTNANGVFNMSLSLLTTLLSTLLNGCKLVVTTPLSSCNASLPTTGVLQSVLQLIGLVGSLLGPVYNLIPAGFSLVQ